MRKLLLLLPLLAAQLLAAQWTPRLVRKFDGYRIDRMITHGDGYLALVSTSRLVPYKGTSTTTARTPILMALDRNFEELWRHTFPEEKYRFSHIHVIDGKIHIPGTAFADNGWETAVEVCCDLKGNVLWERKHTFPGCGASSHFGIDAVYGQDYKVVYRVASCKGSSETVHQRIRPDGSVVWTRREPNKLGSFAHTMRMMENGDELQVGHVKSGETGNLWTYDLMVRMYSWETGKLLWEKRNSLPAEKVQMNGILLLPDGNIGINGTYSYVVDGYSKEHAFAGLLSRNGDLLDWHQWRDGQYTMMADAVQLPDGAIIATAKSKDANHWREFPMIYTFDAHMRLLTTQRIDADPFSYVHIGVGGVPYVHTQDAVWVLDRSGYSGR